MDVPLRTGRFVPHVAVLHFPIHHLNIFRNLSCLNVRCGKLSKLVGPLFKAVLSDPAGIEVSGMKMANTSPSTFTSSPYNSLSSSCLRSVSQESVRATELCLWPGVDQVMRDGSQAVPAVTSCFSSSACGLLHRRSDRHDGS